MMISSILYIKLDILTVLNLKLSGIAQTNCPYKPSLQNTFPFVVSQLGY
jgi:hypothetical protein